MFKREGKKGGYESHCVRSNGLVVITVARGQSFDHTQKKRVCFEGVFDSFSSLTIILSTFICSPFLNSGYRVQAFFFLLTLEKAINVHKLQHVQF